MRKSRTIAAGVAASLALGGGVAVAQNAAPAHTLQVSGVATKAGTKKRPKAVGLNLDIRNNRESGTTASRIEVFFAKNIRINPKGFKTCTPAKIEAEGATACPSKSKIGTGTAGAVVNPRSATPSPISFKNTFFVGSSNSLTIYLEQTEGDVRAILQGKLSSAGGGKFGQKMTISIPETLQQPAPGVYSALTDIAVKLKGTTGSGRKKHGIFEATGCTGGLHDFQTRITYANNPTPPAAPTSTATDTVACKK